MKADELAPDEILDYGWDWSRWLGADTIQSSTWITDSGLTIVSQGNDTTSASAFLALGAGVAAGRYVARNKIATAGGRTAVRTKIIRAVEHKYA